MELPVETAQDEIADKAEELNIEVVLAEEPAALDPTERDDWSFRNVDIQEVGDPGTANQECVRLLPFVQITVREKGASRVTAA